MTEDFPSKRVSSRKAGAQARDEQWSLLRQSPLDFCAFRTERVLFTGVQN